MQQVGTVEVARNLQAPSSESTWHYSLLLEGGNIQHNNVHHHLFLDIPALTFNFYLLSSRNKRKCARSGGGRQRKETQIGKRTVVPSNFRTPNDKRNLPLVADLQVDNYPITQHVAMFWNIKCTTPFVAFFEFVYLTLYCFKVTMTW